MDLFYRKEGRGPVIIVIHGLYGSSDNWISMSRRLAENHTVYLIDQRNHGRSPSSDSHLYDDLKNDLTGFFTKHKIEKATILGHSMGGKAAMWFAADYPEKVEKLVIADIAPKDYCSDSDNSQFGMHRDILRTMLEVDFGKVKKRSNVEEQLMPAIKDPRTRKFLLKNVAKDKHTKHYRWRLNVPVLLKNLEEIVCGVNEKWFEDRKPVTAYPVVFIRGMDSNYIMPEDESLIKSIYPDSVIIDIPDAGHWLHAENPDKFEEAVLRCC
jgi:pimeloyl-ACP methyl ester carboxylesterase